MEINLNMDRLKLCLSSALHCASWYVMYLGKISFTKVANERADIWSLWQLRRLQPGQTWKGQVFGFAKQKTIVAKGWFPKRGEEGIPTVYQTNEFTLVSQDSYGDTYELDVFPQGANIYLRSNSQALGNTTFEERSYIIKKGDPIYVKGQVSNIGAGNMTSISSPSSDLIISREPIARGGIALPLTCFGLALLFQFHSILFYAKRECRVVKMSQGDYSFKVTVTRQNKVRSVCILVKYEGSAEIQIVEVLAFVKQNLHISTPPVHAGLKGNQFELLYLIPSTSSLYSSFYKFSNSLLLGCICVSIVDLLFFGATRAPVLPQ